MYKLHYNNGIDNDGELRGLALTFYFQELLFVFDYFGFQSLLELHRVFGLFPCLFTTRSHILGYAGRLRQFLVYFNQGHIQVRQLNEQVVAPILALSNDFL